MRNIISLLVILLSIAVLATSCRLGPDYRRPEIVMPATYRGVTARDRSLADKKYYEIFEDSLLNQYIALAINQNYDLQATVARIDLAKAAITIQESQWYPSADLSLGGAESKPAANRYPNQPASFFSSLQGLFGVSTLLNWEIDVFGRIARGTQVQRARLSASYAGNRAATLGLIAAVAETYITIRELDAVKERLDSNIANRKEYLALAKLLFEKGKTSELDYRQAESELYRIEVLLAPTVTAIEQTENAFNVLLARPPGTTVERGRRIDDLAVPNTLPTGLPGQLLERRPDVQLAEYELEAATSDIGVAIAQQFPRVALTGEIGLQSVSASNLFDPASFAYQFAGNVAQPIFNAGRNAARVDGANALALQAELAYRSSVLGALRDVNDAVVAITNGKQQIASAELGLVSVTEAARLSQLRYRYGATTYLQVLDAQRSLLDAQRAFISAKANQYRAYIRLYKALGGGW